MDIVTNPLFIMAIFVVSFGIGAYWKMTRPAKQDDGEKNGLRLNVGLVTVVVATVFAFLQLPSLSIDINSIFGYAFNVVNAFMPLIAIIGGLGLGFSLIGKISSLFSRSF